MQRKELTGVTKTRDNALNIWVLHS